MMRAVDATADILQAALWGVAAHRRAYYTEDLGGGYGCRLYNLHRPFKLPFFADCSGSVDDWFCWAGAASPMDNGYAYWGNTATMLANPNGHEVSAAEVVPGDTLFYGAPEAVHVVLVVDAAGEFQADPWVVSMGRQGDPSMVRASTMDFLGPRRYWRFPTKRVAAPARWFGNLVGRGRLPQLGVGAR